MAEILVLSCGCKAIVYATTGKVFEPCRKCKEKR